MYLLLTEKLFLDFWVCVQKTCGNIFGIDSLTEIVSFKITRMVAGEKNGSLFSSQFNVRTYLKPPVHVVILKKSK